MIAVQAVTIETHGHIAAFVTQVGARTVSRFA
jgi:hypothetical protein